MAWAPQLTSLPNKPECYIAMVWKCLSLTNIVSFWAHLQAIKKMKCCKYSPGSYSQIVDQPEKPCHGKCDLAYFLHSFIDEAKMFLRS
jgi:hypothetical protein